jgi:hypothetical protein
MFLSQIFDPFARICTSTRNRGSGGGGGGHYESSI